MATVLESNKVKIAKRVIEVFEYFDENHPTATVMDIVRRYGRPQSSTSELLSSLVDMGLLYKDRRQRSYWPTPRLAVMGAGAQPAPVRDGRLFVFMDRLARSTRYSVALFGMVGTHVQVFHWSPGSDPRAAAIHRGSSEPLSSSVAGQLLLSSMESDQVAGMLRRLNAESEGGRLKVAELAEQVAALRHAGHATGAAGFLPDHQVTAIMLRAQPEERPLALGIIYPEGAAVDTNAMLATLERGIGGAAPLADGAEAQDAPLMAPMMAAV
ncbi:helix-turn-helix domain-containing protein [Novosphingobium bradum]|uniref:Helix-turn-helix domain-containing protein n=1 Tax=Novosphingobium bradum TaxID=1737444 RepID=A0ABV7IJ02_9SPHN